jgi:hypothetical protein
MKQPSKIKEYLDPTSVQNEDQVQPEQQVAPVEPAPVAPAEPNSPPDATYENMDENSVGQSQQQVAAPVVAPVVPQVAPVKTTDDYVRDLYAINPPQPKVDQAKLDRIQKMGRLNMLGRGVGVLGDILNSSVGARVNKAAPDTTTPSLIQEYLQTMDKNKADQDRYDQEVYQGKKQNADFEVRYSEFKEANALKNRMADLTEKRDKAKDEESKRNFELKLAQTQAQIDGLKSQRTETHRHNIVKEVIDQNKSIKPVNIMTSSGQRHALSSDEFSYLTNEATGNQAILNDPKYSQWFDKVEKTKSVPNARFGGYEKVPTGEFSYKIKPTADKHALAQAMLELYEQGKISIPGRKDQPKQENSPTVPAWTPPAPGTVTGPPVGKWANGGATESPSTVATPQQVKKTYSTGGYY